MNEFYPGESKASIAGHKVAAFLKSEPIFKLLCFAIAFPLIAYACVALYNLVMFFVGFFQPDQTWHAYYPNIFLFHPSQPKTMNMFTFITSTFVLDIISLCYLGIWTNALKLCDRTTLFIISIFSGWLWFCWNNTDVVIGLLNVCFWGGIVLFIFIGMAGKTVSNCASSIGTSSGSCKSYNNSSTQLAEQAEASRQRLYENQRIDEEQKQAQRNANAERNRRLDEQRQQGFKIASARQVGVNRVQLILVNNSRCTISGELVTYTSDTVTVKVNGRYQVKDRTGKILNSYM